MTNERAIQILENLTSIDGDVIIGSEDKEALEMAVHSLQQEQQEVDLEKEIEDYWIATGWSKVMTLGKFKVIARYFYGLGQLNSK